MEGASDRADLGTVVICASGSPEVLGNLRCILLGLLSVLLQEGVRCAHAIIINSFSNLLARSAAFLQSDK